MVPIDKLSDGELLAGVASQEAQDSFAELIRRHGPMIMDVCRQQLGNRHDAEDAAQAVLLVLWQKAVSLRQRPSVAGWVHQVARNICRNARRARTVREKLEREVSVNARVAGKPHREESNEIKDLLNDQLSALPEKYRTPIILFHLEGRSLEETTALVQIKMSTLTTRLNRGRELLRKRLLSRGITLSTAALIGLLNANAATSAMPLFFAETTTRAASLYGLGQITAGELVSPQTLALTKGALDMLTTVKLRTVFSAMFAIVLILGTGSFLVWQATAGSTPKLKAAGDGADFSNKLIKPAPKQPNHPVGAQIQPPFQVKFKQLPEATVQAWKRAEAEVGWMGPNVLGLLSFTGTTGKSKVSGEVPAFRFIRWWDGVVPKLPVPQQPFGLSLNGTVITDAGLKELSTIKNLELLDLGRTKVTDKGMKEVAKLTNMESLALTYTQVTDEGLKELAPLKNLEYLQLGFTQVTDNGLKELAGFKEIKYLDLRGTKVTDANLKELAALKNLETLYFYGAKVGDTGLKDLAPLKNLKTLRLGFTQVTDEGLKYLKELKSLKLLSLYGTKVTDKGLKDLAALDGLESLRLDSTQVTDKGLKELVMLKNLQTLRVVNTQVTDEGVAELRKALPQCQIVLR